MLVLWQQELAAPYQQGKLVNFFNDCDKVAITSTLALLEKLETSLEVIPSGGEDSPWIVPDDLFSEVGELLYKDGLHDNLKMAIGSVFSKYVSLHTFTERHTGPGETNAYREHVDALEREPIRRKDLLRAMKKMANL